jgi:hypothetical protein
MMAARLAISEAPDLRSRRILSAASSIVGIRSLRDQPVVLQERGWDVRARSWNNYPRPERVSGARRGP